MNAEKYLTTKQILIELSSEIRSLDGKSIVIIDSEEREVPANLRVSEADPTGADAGKWSVVVWLSRVDKIEWQSASPSTTQTGGCERFLTRDALGLIRPNDRDPIQGDLILILPPDGAHNRTVNRSAPGEGDDLRSHKRRWQTKR